MQKDFKIFREKHFLPEVFNDQRIEQNEPLGRM